MSQGPEYTRVESPFIDQLQSMGWKSTTGNDAGMAELGDSCARRPWS